MIHLAILVALIVFLLMVGVIIVAIGIAVISAIGWRTRVFFLAFGEGVKGFIEGIRGVAGHPRE